MTARRQLAVGDVIQAAEPDYAYGLGELYLRVTALPRQLDRGDGWGEVRGRDIGRDGEDSPTERYVTVRLAGVRVVAEAGTP